MPKLIFFPVLLLLVAFKLNAADHSTGFYLFYGNTIQIKNHATTLGMKWDWSLYRNFSLAGEYHGFISDDYQEIKDYLLNDKPEYKLNYGGITISKYLLYTDNSRVSVGVLFASGGLHSWNHVINEYNLNNLYLFIPQISFEMNLNNTFAFGINPGYRFVVDREEMNHVQINLYLKIGTY